MHPRQANLIQFADNTVETLMPGVSRTAAAIVLWHYTDEDGKEFWLPERKTVIYSPYNGKRFSAKPERMSLSEVGKDLKGEGKTAAATVLWKYADPEGGEFYLTEKRMTIRSPYTGKSFKPTPERMSLSDVSQELKTDAKAETEMAKTAAIVLWKYADPEGGEFYLPKKMVTIRSPYTGKSFKAKPERMSMSDVSTELKTDAKTDAAAKVKKATLDEWLP